MVEADEFTMAVERDPRRSGRFRWAFSLRGEIDSYSPVTFATKREALADAERSFKKRVADWRATR